MSAFRKEILDKLENELKNPSTFLKQMLAASKTGMISLSIIQQMSGELCNIPLDYIIHCIKKDDRFAFDPYQVKACLRSQVKTKLTKTTPYGTIDPDDDDDDDSQIQENKEKEKTVESYPEYKTPFFRPMFSSIEKVFPIFFDNDTFYVDDLPEHQVNPEEPYVAVPEFDLYDIKPLTNDEDTLASSQGLPRSGVECFNCGSPDHKFNECPQPTDLKRIKKKRRQVASKEKFDRLYKELEIRNRVNTFVPGEISSTLSDALGMNEVEEPPYYRKMRIHGYPPGYVIDVDPSKPVPTFQSLNERNFKLDIEDLKVYDDAYVMNKKEDDDKKIEPREEEKRVKMKLVDYGVDFDELKPEPEPEKKEVAFDGLEAAMQRYNFAKSETNGNTNPSLNNHYYQQQQQQQQQHQQTENVYQPEYSYQNSQDPYSYYYGYYDYSAYQQYSEYPPPPPPPPPPASEPPPPASSPPAPPAPPSQNIHPDPSNHQPPTIQNHTIPQINTSQPVNDNDDDDSVDMEISDDDDDS